MNIPQPYKSMPTLPVLTDKMEVSPRAASISPADAISTCLMNENSGNDHAVLLPEKESGVGTCASGPPVAACALHDMLDEQEQQYLRPILVGYAFGPKKMSTMGVVMAEASKALSTVTMAATRVGDIPKNESDSGTRISPMADAVTRKKGLEPPSSSSVGLLEQDEASQGTHTTAASSSRSSPLPAPRLTSAALEEKNATDGNSMDLMGIAAAAADEDNVSITAHDRVEDVEDTHPHPTGGIKFSIAGGPDGSGAGGIRNIIRFFQSNCSSAASFADSSITAGTCTTAGGGGAFGGGGVLRSASYADSATCSVSTDGAGIQQIHPNRSGTRLQAVRVSFVPIDLDLPLEEQHGGKFDASKFSLQCWDVRLANLWQSEMRGYILSVCSISNTNSSPPSLIHVSSTQNDGGHPLPIQVKQHRLSILQWSHRRYQFL